MLLYIGEKNVLAFRSSVMEELEAVENYLLRGAYPSGLSKGEKANLRRKCKNNFKLEDGILYYKRAVTDGESKEPWRICVRSEEDKRRVIESCHAGVEGKFR